MSSLQNSLLTLTQPIETASDEQRAEMRTLAAQGGTWAFALESAADDPRTPASRAAMLLRKAH